MKKYPPPYLDYPVYGVHVRTGSRTSRTTHTRLSARSEHERIIQNLRKTLLNECDINPNKLVEISVVKAFHGQRTTLRSRRVRFGASFKRTVEA